MSGHLSSTQCAYDPPHLLLRESNGLACISFSGSTHTWYFRFPVSIYSEIPKLHLDGADFRNRAVGAPLWRMSTASEEVDIGEEYG